MSAPWSKRKQMINNITKKDLKLLLECVKNILVGNIPIQPEKKKRLGRHRQKLRHLVSRKLGIKSKLRILKQKGGILPAILSVLTPAIVTAIAELLR